MKKDIVTLLALISIILLSCDGIDHQSIDFRKAESLMPQYPDSALAFLEQIKSPSSLSRKDKARYYLLLTEARDKTYATHTTDSLIAIATDYYEDTDDLVRKSKAWYYRGRINQDLGHPLKAQEYYLKALRDEERIGDYALLGRINNNIGLLYTQQNVYERALRYQRKAILNFKVIADSVGQIYALRDLGRIHRMLHQKDSAIVCYSKALDLMANRKVFAVYSELSSLYVETKAYPEAERLLHEVLANERALGNDIYPSYLTLGKYYYHLDRLDSAKVYLEQCAEKTKRLETRAGAVYYLSQIALSKKQWVLYADLNQRYEMMRDTLEQAEVADMIRGKQTLYDEQDKQKSLAEEQVRTANANLRMVVISIIALCIILSITYLLFKYKKRQKELLRIQKENRERIFSSDKTIMAYEQQIERNKQIIETLNRSLREKDREREELMDRLRREFEQKNQELYAQKEHQLELLRNLKDSSVYKNFYENENWKPLDEDWEELYRLIDDIYPSFARKLQEIYPEMSIQTKRLCYLVRIHVRPSHLSTLLNHSNMSVLRKRLYFDLTGKSGKASDFDQYINDL
ncbi:tetratricopeptide repeat protein [Parabacteroides sp.]|uniref:tetratricopeptide repeat protein n=1 Tax=Parabacteroides sp. TaxID=1869337 RepID=UPI00257E5937|nr:tetratricopeptide repeat protein [Parabacteroides sp.]